MSHFKAGIENRIEHVREQLAKARSDDDDHLVDVLLGELDSLVNIAERNDLNTDVMNQILVAETGALPVIEDPQDTAPA